MDALEAERFSPIVPIAQLAEGTPAADWISAPLTLVAVATPNIGVINVGLVWRTVLPVPVVPAAGVPPEYGTSVDVRASRIVVLVPAVALVIMPVVPPMVYQSGVRTTT